MTKKTKVVTGKGVRFLAKKVALFKGGPWSESEFEMMKTSIHYHLKEDGATEMQLKKFDQIVEGAPIVGGFFNSSDIA